MTWTYMNPMASDAVRDAVRLRIGDTDAADQQLQDEEIDPVIALTGATLTSYRSMLQACIECAEILGARYARKGAGGGFTLSGFPSVQIQYGELSEHYYTMADRWRRELASGGVGVYVGGRSVGEKQSERAPSDLVETAFTRDMMQHPGTGDTTEPESPSG